jgi:putative membrane protein
MIGTIVGDLLRGVAIGLANIIPGVSGGTMALILGIYQRLITAIGNLGSKTLTAPFRGMAALKDELKRIDALLLILLAVGALGIIVAVARVMPYLLDKQHDPTYGLFFGLVLVSVVVPYRMIKRKGVGVVIACIAALALVVGLTMALSGEERLASAQKKASMKAAAAAKVVEDGGKPVAADRVPQDAATIAIFFAAGAIAISAMILPGISGSFMLLLLGVYFDVLAAVNNRQFVLLAAFAAGCGIGLLLFTKLLKFLLDRYHDLTMGFLLGLVMGSLWAIWPFKSFGMAGGKRVDMDNVLPAGFGQNELITLGTVVAGGAIVAVFIWIEIRQSKKK